MIATLAYRYAIIPAFESLWKRRKTYRYWRELNTSQWLDPAEIRKRQLESLRSLIKHTESNCEYYREKWNSLEIKAETLSSLEDFSQWPLTTRDDILKHRHGMRDQRTGQNLISKATGGSSGQPLQFDLDQNSNDRREAAWHRGYSWANAGPGTRQVYLWGVPLGQQTRFHRIKYQLHQRWLYRRQILNSFELKDDNTREFLRRYNRARPDALIAYTNPLYSFARSVKALGLRPFSPKSIVVGAEKLHPFQRELIQDVFQAPVFETYGSREFMLIAAECDRHEGLHITSEHLLVELLDDNGKSVEPGKEGNVVVTDLFNYGMPFIRYPIGDRAVLSSKQCSCGRGLPMLDRIVGRKLDIIKTPDGRQVPGEYFPHLLKDFASIKRFQVTQDVQGKIVIKLIVDNHWNSEQSKQLEQLIRQTVGDSVPINFYVVDDIELTSAGKLQVVVSHFEPSPSELEPSAIG